MTLAGGATTVVGREKEIVERVDEIAVLPGTIGALRARPTAAAGLAGSSLRCCGSAGRAWVCVSSFSGRGTIVGASVVDSVRCTGKTVCAAGDGGAGDAGWVCTGGFVANRSPNWISVSPN